MARFYMRTTTERGLPKTKAAATKMETHVSTWNHGIRVEYVHLGDNKVSVHVYQTGGSNSPKAKKLLYIADLDNQTPTGKRQLV